MTKAPRLSDTQKEALISLFRGWHFGVDGRTARGLETRGLIFMHNTYLINGLDLILPFLTPEGRVIARGLHMRELAAAKAQRRGSFYVIHGGAS